MKIDRRRFLTGSAGTLLATSVASATPAWARAAWAGNSSAGPKTLILVQLVGGNDGLNWIVPHGHDAYYRARPSVSIPSGQVLEIDDEIGFHPGCSGLHALWKEGQVSVIQGVGYPNPDRSHFRSMDIWDSARPDLETPRDGWIGRWLANRADDPQSMSALRVGQGPIPLSLMAEGFETPSLQRREDLELLGDDQLADWRARVTRAPRTDGPGLESVRLASRRAWQVSEELNRKSSHYQPKAEYPGSELGQKLSLVAQLMSSGFGTRVFHVALGGFDTHSRQRPSHDALMQILSQALTAFWRDLSEQGLADRVLALVYSEFGRRVAENGSQGTDHGAAAPVVLLGNGFSKPVLGTHPSFESLDDGDLQHAIDFRSIYRTVLEDWFESDAQPVLGKTFPKVDLLS